MSAMQLRQRALRAARMDALLRQETLNPVITQVVEDYQDTVKAVVVPQGNWVVSLHKDGSIRVYPSYRISDPLLIVDRPDFPPEWTWYDGSNNVVLSSVGDKYIAVAWECFSDN